MAIILLAPKCQMFYFVYKKVYSIPFYSKLLLNYCKLTIESRNKLVSEIGIFWKRSQFGVDLIKSNSTPQKHKFARSLQKNCRWSTQPVLECMDISSEVQFRGY